MKIAPTNGGDGLNSYYRNSGLLPEYSQKNGATSVFAMIEEAIFAEDLDVQNHQNTNLDEPFRIADLGCSVGPNTFLVVRAIIEALKLNYYSHGDDVPADRVPGLLQRHRFKRLQHSRPIPSGRVEEHKADLFNFPSYNPTEAELKMLIEKNGSFSIEKMEALPPPKMAFDVLPLCNLAHAFHHGEDN
ncbi:hypothetical protein H6P81_009008 [Aristolochia fimbriata]|uniref:Uncharacterized protein n=1 Tax=Aristolochia fimbriata TaxID=158543 RepID=A0AAV7EP61_ARIFI|nr:hypothetical protein H6P81_009008 [Aristolochia fimbriata]